MKKDLHIFFSLPLIVLAFTLLILSLLHISAILEVSLASTLSSIEMILLLLLLYYVLTGIYVYQNMLILKGKQARIAHSTSIKSSYGSETKN